MRVTIGEEPLTDELLSEGEPLARAHNAEVFGEAVPFAYNRALLLAMAEAGAIVCVTLRDGLLLGGYCTFMIGPSLRSTQTYAIDAGLFLAPEYRKGMLAHRLITHAVGVCRDRGVNVVQLQMPVGNPCHALMARLGFAQTDLVFQKELG